MMASATEPGRPLSSLVILERGTRTLSAVLGDVVARRYRAVASAEAWMVRSDASPLDAVGRALRGLEAASGRRLMNERGVVIPTSPDGVGCDSILVAGGRPLKAAFVAFGKVASTVLDGVDPLVIEIGTLLSVEGVAEERVGLTAEIATLLRENRPDVLVVVGGPDNGSADSPLTLGRALTVAHANCPGGLPTMVLVAIPSVRERFNAGLRRHGHRAPGALPTIREVDPEGLGAELRLIWSERESAQPVWQVLAGGIGHGPAPRLESLGRACQALAGWRESAVWAVEIGDSDVVVMRAGADRIDTQVRSIGQLKLQRDTDEVDEWLRRPWLAPNDRASVERQRALTIQAIAEVASEVRSQGRSEPLPGLIVGRGVGLVHRLPSTDAAAALCLGIGLTGPVTVALDRHGLLAGAGILLESRPDAAEDLIRDSLDLLGAVVVGRTVDVDGAHVRVEGGPEGEKAPSDVRLDELTVLSAADWANTEITLTPSRSVDVGSGEGHRGQVTLGEGEIGAVLTIARGPALRRWARVQGSRIRFPDLIRRTS